MLANGEQICCEIVLGFLAGGSLGLRRRGIGARRSEGEPGPLIVVGSSEHRRRTQSRVWFDLYSEKLYYKVNDLVGITLICGPDRHNTHALSGNRWNPWG